MKDWIETYSGAAFDLVNQEPGDVNMNDIFHGLARINRFTGQADGDGYSVAEHALHVCRRVMELHPGEENSLLHALALHHDDHEAITGDVSAPMKWLLRQMHRERFREGSPDVDRDRSDLDVIEDRVQNVILDALDLPRPTKEQRKIIKEADLWMLKIERWSLMPNTGKQPWGTNDGQPAGWQEHSINTGVWRGARPDEIEARFRLWSKSLLAMVARP